MTLTPALVGDNPYVPGIAAYNYVPDQLIAGDLKLVTDTVTITGAALLQRGSVLGQVTIGAASVAAKAGNTGNGVFTLDPSTPILANAAPGAYAVTCIAAAANAATFRVTDPKGVVLGDISYSGSGASAAFADRIKFTVADGTTDFAVSDAFTVTVAAGSNSYKLSAAAATDGSATPIAVLADTVDASGGDVTGPVYLQGEFNANALILGAGQTLAVVKPALRLVNIFVKTPVSAADPS